MKQRLLGLASALSIALFGAVVLLFVLLNARPNRRAVAFNDIPLVARHATADIAFDYDHWTIKVFVPLPEFQSGPIDRQAQRAWATRLILNARRSGRFGFGIGRNYPDFSWDSVEMRLIGHHSFAVVPSWFLLIVSSILTLRTAFASWRRQRRERIRKAGLCLGCGYDLRASSGRCPECGAAIDWSPQERLARGLIDYPKP